MRRCSFGSPATRSYIARTVASFGPKPPADGPQSLDVTHVSDGPGASTYPNGCHVCEVEVDPDTGTVEIVRYSCVNDFGTVINPLIVEGQLHGGVVQGIGQVLMRVLEIGSTSLEAEQIARADVYIRPHFGTSSYTDTKQLPFIIQAGYKAASEALSTYDSSGIPFR